MCYPLTEKDKQWAWDNKTKTEVAGLLNNIKYSEFNVSFYTLLFAYTKYVAKQLLSPSKDVLSDYQYIGNTIVYAQAESEECFRGVVM